jgi:hypothetical protein
VWDLQQHRAHDRDLTVLDVRQPQEWHAGHIAEALFITGAELPARSEEVARDRPVRGPGGPPRRRRRADCAVTPGSRPGRATVPPPAAGDASFVTYQKNLSNERYQPRRMSHNK